MTEQEPQGLAAQVVLVVNPSIRLWLQLLQPAAQLMCLGPMYCCTSPSGGHAADMRAVACSA